MAAWPVDYEPMTCKGKGSGPQTGHRDRTMSLLGYWHCWESQSERRFN